MLDEKRGLPLFFFVGPHTDVCGPNLPLYHIPRNLSRENFAQKTKNKNPVFCADCHLHFENGCDIIPLSVRDSNPHGGWSLAIATAKKS